MLYQYKISANKVYKIIIIIFCFQYFDHISMVNVLVILVGTFQHCHSYILNCHYYYFFCTKSIGYSRIKLIMIISSSF